MTCKYGSTFITGSPWQEACGEIVWNASQEVDIAPIIGAASAFLTARGNIQETIPVPVSLNFPSAEAAIQYCAQIPWTLPPQAPLRFTDGDLVFLFEKAAFVNIERQRRGASVDLVYEFAVTGPPIINPAPEPLPLTTTFTNRAFTGWLFEQWMEVEALPAGSILKSVAADVVLVSMTGNFGNSADFTVFVGANPPDYYDQYPDDPILQVGGQYNFGGVRYYWDNGYDNTPGTPVVSVIDVSAENVVLSGTNVYIGNGWWQNATWSGSVTILYQPPS
jgi:hypothetical protein